AVLRLCACLARVSQAAAASPTTRGPAVPPKIPVARSGIFENTAAASPADGHVPMVARGFSSGRMPPTETDARIPHGQYLEQGFPVLSAGPTPRVRTEEWSFTLKHRPRPIKKWNWGESQHL